MILQGKKHVEVALPDPPAVVSQPKQKTLQQPKVSSSRLTGSAVHSVQQGTGAMKSKIAALEPSRAATRSQTAAAANVEDSRHTTQGRKRSAQTLDVTAEISMEKQKAVKKSRKN